MSRLVLLLLALALAVGGCSGDESREPATHPPTESGALPPSGSPTAAPGSRPAVPSDPAPVGVAEFCTLVRTVTTADAEERGAAVLVLLQRGLPADLRGDAKDGLQVLLDVAPELTGVRASWRAYRDLDDAQRSDLRSFGWFVTKECGQDYLADLVPDLPELSELPGLRELLRR